MASKKKVTKAGPAKKKAAPKKPLAAKARPMGPLLEAWMRLFAKRPDVEVSRLEFSRDAEASPQLPDDARALGEHATRIEFSYKLKDGGGGGMLYLSLEGLEEDAWLELDGEEVDPEAMRMLEYDAEGTGFAAWYVLREGKAPCIVWDLETKEQFGSLTEYLSEGARRAFSYSPSCWQSRAAPPSLAERSAPRTTPPKKLEAMLVQQGADARTARDLVAWLGTDVRLLLAAPAPVAKKKAAPPVAETLITWRLADLPAGLREGVPAALDGLLFYAGRGPDNALVAALGKAMPEQPVAHAAAGMLLAQTVQRLLAELTAAHVAVKARGAFVHGFHSAPASEVEAWLRANGGTLEPLRPLLDRVLMVRVENAGDDEELVRTAYGWSVRPKAPRLYAFDGDDLGNQQPFEIKGAAGVTMIDPSTLVRGEVNTVKLR